MSHLYKFKTVLELKRYSKNTIDIYLSFVRMFQEIFSYDDERMEKLEDQDIMNSIISIIKSKNYSRSSQKQLIGAIRLFYKELLHREVDLKIIYPHRKSEFLPTVLSKKEVKLLFEKITNIKHLAILSTIYGLGLRVSEVIALKIEDIDNERMLVNIKNSKSNKDRVVMLPSTLLALLNQYLKKYRPQTYLFEGQSKDLYSASGIRKIFMKATSVANITKHATAHTLRHSFATHLLESGTDIKIIQKLLGHKNMSTTLLYKHVAQSTIQNVESPLDTL